jgi:hypothetical protein
MMRAAEEDMGKATKNAHARALGKARDGYGCVTCWDLSSKPFDSRVERDLLVV